MEKNSDYAHLIISGISTPTQRDATTSGEQEVNASYHGARKVKQHDHKQIKHIFIPKGISPLVRPVQASL
jgi:hypothetical protein